MKHIDSKGIQISENFTVVKKQNGLKNYQT